MLSKYRTVEMLYESDSVLGLRELSDIQLKHFAQECSEMSRQTEFDLQHFLAALLIANTP